MEIKINQTMQNNIVGVTGKLCSNFFIISGVLLVTFYVLQATADTPKKTNAETVGKALIQMHDSGTFSNPEINEKLLEVKKTQAEVKRLENRLEIHKERIEIYNEAQRLAAKRPDKDMSLEVKEGLIKKYNISPSEAEKIMRNRDPKAYEVLKELMKPAADQLLQEATIIVRQRKKQNSEKKNESVN